MSREVVMVGGPLDGERLVAEARYIEAVASIAPPKIARYEVRGDKADLIEIREVRLD